MPSAGLDRGPDRNMPVETYNHAGVDRIVPAELRILRRDGQQSRLVCVPGVRDDQTGETAAAGGQR